jgi:hypothetical protein
VEKDEMGRACSTNKWVEEENIQVIGAKSL